MGCLGAKSLKKWVPGPRFPRKLARLRRAAWDSKRSESLTRVTFRHPFLTEFYFLCKATIMSSNMLVHEPASRFGPALRLPRRSWTETAAFEASRLNPGLTPVHLGDPVQWVNQPMVHLVNRSTGLDQSTPISHRSAPANHRSTAAKVGQRRSTFFFSSGSSQEVKRLYTDFKDSDHRKFCRLIYKQLQRKY
ncbi:hypothetical protein PIB30_035757 [Stylosanthes scabra]|uniref:Uncharacterized protein n=1 Tax=Stylosanthes scabra TaxID=79078 RepID=A0ABU6RDC7_9FABA|nr:hypothetical protein [Stylosanthes scabra]